MITKDSNFHKLHETDKFILGYVFEYAYLVSKESRNEIYIGDFYGDPHCGLISDSNNWCLVGGDTLSVWKKDGNITNISDVDICWISKIRQTGLNEVELLIDPWADNGGVWKLNVDTFERQKLRDFKVDSEYSEDFDW